VIPYGKAPAPACRKRLNSLFWVCYISSVETIEPTTKAGKLKNKLTEEELGEIYERLLPMMDDIEAMLIYEGRPLWQIAKQFNVRYKTLLTLCESEKCQELHEIWGEWVEKNRRVTDSLYLSAIGGYYEEEQVFKVKEITDYRNKKGQLCKKTQEVLKTVTVKRYMPPNFQSMQFYLTNRDSKNWKTEIKLANSTGEQTSHEPCQVMFIDPKTPEQIDRLNAIEAGIK